jgi:hypothetical protein
MDADHAVNLRQSIIDAALHREPDENAAFKDATAVVKWIANDAVNARSWGTAMARAEQTTPISDILAAAKRIAKFAAAGIAA